MLTEDRCLLGGVDHEREHWRQLVFHLGLAKENGATEEELIEAITHLAFYAGWPKAMSAMAVAKQVFRGGSTD
jgi:alkylhydroperoxidase/carboxymuconolactone decarboxylase family protein YurZ